MVGLFPIDVDTDSQARSPTWSDLNQASIIQDRDEHTLETTLVAWGSSDQIDGVGLSHKGSSAFNSRGLGQGDFCR